jgi:hypothetical protein
MSFTITPSAALGIDFGYNSHPRYDTPNWNDVLLGLIANLRITQYVSIHTGVQISIALDSLNDIQERNDAIANVGFNVNF